MWLVGSADFRPKRIQGAWTRRPCRFRGHEPQVSTRAHHVRTTSMICLTRDGLARHDFTAGMYTPGRPGSDAVPNLCRSSDRCEELSTSAIRSQGPFFLFGRDRDFPVLAVQSSTARRARTSQCWPPLRRPPAGLGVDRPSTVLRCKETVTIIGTVRFRIIVFLRERSRPEGTRPAASGQAGLGRATSFVARKSVTRPKGGGRPNLNPGRTLYGNYLGTVLGVIKAKPSGWPLTATSLDAASAQVPHRQMVGTKKRSSDRTKKRNRKKRTRACLSAVRITEAIVTRRAETHGGSAASARAQEKRDPPNGRGPTKSPCRSSAAALQRIPSALVLS